MDPRSGTVWGRFLVGSATAPDSFLSRSKRLRLLLRLLACGQRGGVVHHVHSPGADDRLAPDRHWHTVCQRLVRASIIVEIDPLSDAARGFAAIGVALEIDVLVLERPPEPIDEHVVHPAASAVHGDRDARFGERAGEGRPK